jgi:hypothetical protein
MAGFKKLGCFRAPSSKKQSKSTTTITAHSKNKPSPKLLELPAEVRNKIVRYVLVSNEPIKVQFTSCRWRSSRRHFTMIPGLINASKQLRSETRRIFFEENTFEITPEVWKLKQRGAAPLLLLRTMHHNLGLDLRSVRVGEEIKMRVQKVLFQLKGSFTIGIDADGGLVISEQDYFGTYIGRSLPVTPHLGVCGCVIAQYARIYNRMFKERGLVWFLLKLKDRNGSPCGIHRSYHLIDLIRKDEVVYAIGYCQECRARGGVMVTF